MEINTQVEQLHEKRLKKKNEDSLRELQDNMKCNNILIIEVLEGEEKKQGIETLFGKNNHRKLSETGERKKNMQVQEQQRVLIMMNQRRPTPRHIT